MFPVQSAPRSLSRQMSPSSWLIWRETSSAGTGAVPIAPREGFAGTRLATRLMAISSQYGLITRRPFLLFRAWKCVGSKRLDRQILISRIAAWASDVHRHVSPPPLQNGDQNQRVRLDDYQICKAAQPMGRSVQSSALQCRLNHKGLVQQRKTLHAAQVISQS